MATTNQVKYGSPAQVTCGIASLASGSARESAVVTNTASPLAFDYEVGLTFTIKSGSPSTSGPTVNVWGNGSVDGTLWPIIQLSSGATVATGAGDASVGALGSPPNLALIGSFGIQTTTSSGERTFRTQPYSLAQGFAGCPQAFSLIIDNETGVAFSTSTVTTANYLQVTPTYSSSGN